MKLAIQIIECIDGIPEGVTVRSVKGAEIVPNQIDVSGEYSMVTADQYDILISTLTDNEDFDIVSFTLKHPDKPSLKVVRGFFKGEHLTPVTESIHVLDDSGKPINSSVYVRDDVLAVQPLPFDVATNGNILCDVDYMRTLFADNLADWGTVVGAATGKNISLYDIVGGDTEHFVLDGNNWESVLSVYDRHSFPGTYTKDKLTKLVITEICHSLIRTLSTGIFGNPNETDLIINASEFGLDSITLHAKDGVEEVYSVRIHSSHGDKVYLVFGAENEQDASATFIDQFELEAEHITAVTFKTIELKYFTK